MTMQLRVARHTQQLEEIVSFYRDGIGLPEIGRFNDHEGYQGVFLALPGTEAHLEFTSGGRHRAPASHPESLLVLYLGDDESVRKVASRLDAASVTAANPYWAEHGTTFADPDGFRIVLVPDRWRG
jgi:catechol 2,3-dioxygenase-like lactoylglutathione lyase family enzyme